MGKRQSRFAAWRSQLADRLAQSSQVFLLGLVIACGVEVLVDWNQTLFEINVLRDQIRQKGLNYAGLLARAVVEPVLSRDRATFDRLAQGLLDDEDAVFVRIVDPSALASFCSMARSSTTVSMTASSRSMEGAAKAPSVITTVTGSSVICRES